MKKGLASVGVATVLAVCNAGATPTNDTVTHSNVSLSVYRFQTGLTTHTSLQIKQHDGTFWACAAGGFDFKISKSHPSHEQMLKFFLAAYLSGRKIDVSYENVSAGCWIKTVQFATPPF
jgi:hypothetical protein